MVASSPTNSQMETNTECNTEKIVEATKLLKNGKRNLVMRRMSEAVAQLEESCQLFVQIYGEKAEECGEVYYSYGCALLELARMESGVLGNALQGIKEDGDESELNSSRIGVDSDIKMTEEESEQLTETIVNAMTEEERQTKLEGEDELKKHVIGPSGDNKPDISSKKQDVGESYLKEREHLDLSPIPHTVNDTIIVDKSEYNDFIVEDQEKESGDIKINISEDEMMEEGDADDNVKIVSDDNVKIISDDNIKKVAKDNVKIVADDNVKIVTDDNVKIVTDDNVKIVSDDDTKIVSDDDTKIVSDDDTKIVSDDDTKIVVAEDNVKIVTDDNVKIASDDVKIISDKAKTVSDDDVEIVSDDNVKIVSDDNVKLVSDDNVKMVSDDNGVDISDDNVKIVSDDNVKIVSDNNGIVISHDNTEAKTDDSEDEGNVKMVTDENVIAEPDATKIKDVDTVKECSDDVHLTKDNGADVTDEKTDATKASEDSDVQMEDALVKNGSDASKSNGNEKTATPEKSMVVQTSISISPDSNGDCEKKALESKAEDKGLLSDENEDEAVEEDDDEIEDDAVEEDDEEDEEEDVSNLQLAWEVLEVARYIFTLKTDKENEIKSSQVLNKLGELGIEGEQYSQAIGDFESSLKLQMKYFEKDDRRLAHTNYQLGIVYAFDKQHNKALIAIDNAISGLKERTKNLMAMLESGDKDQLKVVNDELDEIKSILPDIETKKKDVMEDLRDMVEIKGKMIETLSTSISSSGFDKPSESSKNVVANTLIVRKKRKAEDAVDEEDKKAKFCEK